MVAASLRAGATAFQPPSAGVLRADAAVFKLPVSVASGTLMSAEAPVFEPSGGAGPTAARCCSVFESLRADAAVFEPLDAAAAALAAGAEAFHVEAAVFEPPPPPGFGVSDGAAGECCCWGGGEAEGGALWSASSPASTAAPPPPLALYGDGAAAALFSGGASVASPWASPWGSTWGDDCVGMAGPTDAAFALPDAYSFDASSLLCAEQQLDMAQAFDFPAPACGDEAKDEDQQFRLEGIGSLRDSLMALLDGEGAGDQGAEGADNPTSPVHQGPPDQQAFKLEGLANFEESLASILGQLLPTSGDAVDR